MPIPAKRLRPALEPVGAVVFVVLWIVAEAGRYHGAGFYVALSAYTLAIGLSRFLPWTSLAIILLVPVLQLVGILGYPEANTWPIAGASVIVAFVVALSAQNLVKWVGLGVVLLQALIVSVLLVFAAGWIEWIGRGEYPRIPDFLVGYSVFLTAIGMVGCGAAWTVGFAISLSIRRWHDRDMLHQAEADLEAAGFELRSMKERKVIAQEVHDVLAHSLAVIIAVADGSRFLQRSKPEITDEALREIADTARSGLLDLRGLIEGLRDEPSNRPQPGLADLAALTDRLSAAGMKVEAENFGPPRPLTLSQELTVYRIVQESLTNALKHSGPHPAAVLSFDWNGPGLALTIASTGDSLARPDDSGNGNHVPHYGVQNMKDRAHLAGGWLAAGLEDGADPTYLVTAYIPINEHVDMMATQPYTGSSEGAGASA